MKKSVKIFLSLVILLFIIFLIIVLFISKKSEVNNVLNNKNIIKMNENDTINEIKQLNGLSFEQTKIEYKNGVSTLTTTVTNNNSTVYTKDRFKIVIKDKENNKIVTLSAFILGNLAPNESKNIKTAINIDLSTNAYYIEYEEVE